MKLLIKQRVFSWSDTYDIYDEDQQPKYFVQAEFLTLGHRLHIYDSSGNELGVIRQRVPALTGRFEIESGGRVLGFIEKRVTLFCPRYDVDFNGWRVEGNFAGWDYDVYSGDRIVVRISREPFTWGDTYVLDFARPEDELMGLMLVIAIDAANCRN